MQSTSLEGYKLYDVFVMCFEASLKHTVRKRSQAYCVPLSVFTYEGLLYETFFADKRIMRF